MSNKKLLKQGSLEPFYPSISLVGSTKSGENFIPSPYFGSSFIEYKTGMISVWTVGAIKFEEKGKNKKAEVNVSVYQGYPDVIDLVSGKICTSGYIEVRKRGKRMGVSIDAGPGEEIYIPWPNGETAVMVILDADEVMKGEVQNVTFFLKFRRKRNRFLNILG